MGRKIHRGLSRLRRYKKIGVDEQSESVLHTKKLPHGVGYQISGTGVI